MSIASSIILLHCQWHVYLILPPLITSITSPPSPPPSASVSVSHHLSHLHHLHQFYHHHFLHHQYPFHSISSHTPPSPPSPLSTASPSFSSSPLLAPPLHHSTTILFITTIHLLPFLYLHNYHLHQHLHHHLLHYPHLRQQPPPYSPPCMCPAQEHSAPGSPHPGSQPVEGGQGVAPDTGPHDGCHDRWWESQQG